MAKLVMNLHNDQTKADLTLDDISDDSVNRVIDGMFSVFGIGLNSLEPAVHYNSEVASTMEAVCDRPSTIAVPKPAISRPSAETAVKIIPPVSKQEAVSNIYTTDKPASSRFSEQETSQPTLTNNVGEKLMAAMEVLEDEPQWYTTGIKYKDVDDRKSVPHYRTYYYCPNPKCNHRGKHYIEAKSVFTECHECQTKIGVRNATRKPFPERDQHGNFYVASGEYKRLGQ